MNATVIRTSKGKVVVKLSAKLAHVPSVLVADPQKICPAQFKQFIEEGGRRLRAYLKVSSDFSCYDPDMDLYDYATQKDHYMIYLDKEEKLWHIEKGERSFCSKQLSYEILEEMLDAERMEKPYFPKADFSWEIEDA